MPASRRIVGSSGVRSSQLTRNADKHGKIDSRAGNPPMKKGNEKQMDCMSRSPKMWKKKRKRTERAFWTVSKCGLSRFTFEKNHSCSITLMTLFSVADSGHRR